MGPKADRAVCRSSLRLVPGRVQLLGEVSDLALALFASDRVTDEEHQDLACVWDGTRALLSSTRSGRPLVYVPSISCTAILTC